MIRFPETTINLHEGDYLEVAYVDNKSFDPQIIRQNNPNPSNYFYEIPKGYVRKCAFTMGFGYELIISDADKIHGFVHSFKTRNAPTLWLLSHKRGDKVLYDYTMKRCFKVCNRHQVADGDIVTVPVDANWRIGDPSESCVVCGAHRPSGHHYILASSTFLFREENRDSVKIEKIIEKY